MQPLPPDIRLAAGAFACLDAAWSRHLATVPDGQQRACACPRVLQRHAMPLEGSSMTISKFASSTLPRHGVLLLSISGFCAPAADAQTSEQRTDAEPTTLDTLKVQGQRQRRLESPEAVGSRLGLTQRETPASLQVIDHTDIAWTRCW